MKSINIDAEGQYLKLVLHTNHVNQLNLYNQVHINMHIIMYVLLLQVSILALNILGHDPQSHITKSQVCLDIIQFFIKVFCFFRA